MRSKHIYIIYLNVYLCLCVWVAPTMVQDLRAVAEDSVSIRVTWRSPAQPNGLITQYRLQVLVFDILLQDITLTSEVGSSAVTQPANISHYRFILMKSLYQRMSLFYLKGQIKWYCRELWAGGCGKTLSWGFQMCSVDKTINVCTIHKKMPFSWKPP